MPKAAVRCALALACWCAGACEQDDVRAGDAATAPDATVAPDASLPPGDASPDAIEEAGPEPDPYAIPFEATLADGSQGPEARSASFAVGANDPVIFDLAHQYPRTCEVELLGPEGASLAVWQIHPGPGATTGRLTLEVAGVYRLVPGDCGPLHVTARASLPTALVVDGPERCFTGLTKGRLGLRFDYDGSQDRLRFHARTEHEGSDRACLDYDIRTPAGVAWEQSSCSGWGYCPHSKGVFSAPDDGRYRATVNSPIDGYLGGYWCFRVEALEPDPAPVPVTLNGPAQNNSTSLPQGRLQFSFEHGGGSPRVAFSLEALDSCDLRIELLGPEGNVVKGWKCEYSLGLDDDPILDDPKCIPVGTYASESFAMPEQAGTYVFRLNHASEAEFQLFSVPDDPPPEP